MITQKEINKTKKEVARLRNLRSRLIGKISVETINRKINRHLRFIEMAEQKLQNQKV